MRLLDKYIIYSSIFALFSEGFVYNYIIDWKLFYFILLTNTLIFFWKEKLVVNKNMLFFFGFLLIHGVIMFLISRNSLIYLVIQLFGVVLCSFYFYNFIKEYTIPYLFKVYLNMAFIIALIAIPMFYLNINVFTQNRLNGILLEPAHYATIMLPAIYYAFKKKKYFKLLIIFLTVILSKSSVGFIGLFLIVFLPLFKIKNFLKYFAIAFVILSFSFYHLYSNWNISTDEKKGSFIVRRIKQTQEAFEAVHTGKFKKYTNLSSYALLSNTFIAKQIFLNYPLGTGLGSYSLEYEKFYSKLYPPKYLIKQNLSKINKQDANSLFLRLVADLGIFALLMIIYFFYRSFKVFKNGFKIEKQSVFFYLILKLLREGHYFPPEFHFFVLIFLKDFNNENSTYS